jgi:cobyrinic acid a,c-diamide synthase
MLWALVALLKQNDRQLQLFRDQARFAPSDGGRGICGQPARHLDSWMMSTSLCRESFSFGSRGSDLALVFGRYAAPNGSLGGGSLSGGNLSDLASWLRLPQIVVVDVAEMDRCCVPQCPPGALAVLLDRVPESEYSRWQTTLESLWGVPVLGALPELPALRRMMANPTAGGPSVCDLCSELGRRLARTLRVGKLLEIAAAAPELTVEHAIFQPGNKLVGQTIAVAFDDALDCYFPDVLDLLDLQGAQVTDFSPLRDDCLPPETDIVYLGCGRPEKHAEQLVQNQCMSVALRNHVCQGKRLYAEAGGLAYLCQELRMPEGQRIPMTGLLPAVAVFDPRPAPRPVELRLARDHWLGRQGMTLRGYENAAWRLETSGKVEDLASGSGEDYLLASLGQLVASQVHINFAAQPEFLECFRSATSRLEA